MRKRVCSLLLIVVLMVAMIAGSATAANFTVDDPISFDLGVSHLFWPLSRFEYCAAASSVSQFKDEDGNFGFAVFSNHKVTVYKTKHGQITSKLQLNEEFDINGAVTCDADGNLYVVWGKQNKGTDTSVNTIFVNKYTSDGKLLATFADNGGSSYYSRASSTRIPFKAGNCAVAINGDVMMIYYAREMYNGHQSSSALRVNIKTMEKLPGLKIYESHSFDQCAVPFGSGFLLAGHGDALPRAFSVAVTNDEGVVNAYNLFHFWVEKDAAKNNNMKQLNLTYARLGNVLPTKSGVALIAASARSMTAQAKTEPKDLFVQVFTLGESKSTPGSYVTSGTRSGISGEDGDKAFTDYGVSWLTNLAGTGKTIDEVQAVAVNDSLIVVLYDLFENGKFDSTWYMLLNGDGSVKKPAESLGNVRLNFCEPPIYADGAVQWAANVNGTSEVCLNCLPISADGATDPAWGFARLTDIPTDAYYAEAAKWAYFNGITSGASKTQFAPNGYCTRAQIVTFLWRANGSPAPAGQTCQYSDVEKGSYYDKAVLWAVENGITKGTSDTTFSPDARVTRGQAVTFLARAAGVRDDVQGSAQGFTDVTTSDYFCNAVAWAAQNNITQGTGPSVFSPNEACLRCQIVTFIYRTYKN